MRRRLLYIIPYTQFVGKRLYKASDLKKLLEDNYK